MATRAGDLGDVQFDVQVPAPFALCGSSGRPEGQSVTDDAGLDVETTDTRHGAPGVTDTPEAAGETTDTRHAAQAAWQKAMAWTGEVEAKWAREAPARRQRIRQARLAGDTCGRCGRHLEPQEPVSLLRVSLGPWGSHRRMTPVCASCFTPQSDTIRRFVTRPCEGCGRPVSSYSRVRRHWTCSERCERRAYEQRRHPQAGAWQRTCAVCGTAFVAARSDSRTCSHACRQRAYRAARRGPA